MSGGPSYNYAYDRYGNMWHGDGTLSLGFSAGNNRIDGLSYDAAGNVLNDGVHSYAYDAENRLVSVDDGATTYTYDAMGHRVAKTSGGAVTDFIYDREGHLILYTPATPTFTELYVAGMHVTTSYMNSTHTGTTAYFAHADWLGTERARTDPTGAVAETCQSLPFGDGLSCTGASDISFMHFTGKEHDTESNLDYFGARYFSSQVGRFMTPDPLYMNGHHLLDPQALNLYSYAQNDPVSLTDTSGLDIWLKGCGEESNTCHDNYVGTWDKSKKHFTRTHLSGDISSYARLGGQGIKVQYGNRTYQGVWDTYSGESTFVTVGGPVGGLMATATGNCGGTCPVSGFISENGNRFESTQVMSAMTAASGYQRDPGLDFMDFFHKDSNGKLDVNFRGYLPSDPEGLPSTHIEVPTSPNQAVGFHVDSRYPYEDVVGAVAHTGSVIKTILKTVF